MTTKIIPEQLKEQLFCRVRYKDKKPFELKWQNNGYTYEQISKFNNENYGVLTGINNLGVLDDDTESKMLIKLFEMHFKETFRVRDHFYIKLLNWDGKKIIFYEGKNHLGELQGIGQQVVGPGSIHPSGEEYDLRNDCDILEIEYADFMKVFDCFKKQEKEKIVRDTKASTWSGEDIKQIPLSAICSTAGFRDLGGGRFLGEHPIHGATNGGNFLVNTEENTWICFRCNSGKGSHNGCGGPSELIAVMEGIKDCSDVGRNCFTSEEGKKVIQSARDKYGLKVPEVERKPIGLALSINIKNLAKRKGWTKCFNCNNDLKFDEEMGWYNCPMCNVRGGIRKLMENNKK